MKISKENAAIYIFALTGLGYLVTFLFESGYNKYFYIPVYFIDLSIPNITKSIVILVVLSVFSLLYSVFFWDKTDTNSFIRSIWKYTLGKKSTYVLQLLCIIPMLIGTYLVSTQVVERYRFICIPVILVFLLLYFYLKKYLKAVAIVLVSIVLMIPYIVGFITAMNQDEFYFINDSKDFIVIKFNGNDLIVADFIASKQKIEPEFTFYKTEDLATMEMKLSHVKISKVKVGRPQRLE